MVSNLYQKIWVPDYLDIYLDHVLLEVLTQKRS